MGVFDELSVRENGRDVFASWWNDIRTALVLYFGTGIIPETQFTIANNQVAPATITGLLFSSAAVVAITIEYSMIRTTATQRKRIKGYLDLTFQPTEGWAIETTEIRNSSGVTFSIHATTGQVSYVSDDLTGGTYVGKMRYKTTALFAVET